MAAPSLTTETAAGDVLAAVLDYAARGWAVFPVTGKVPLTAHGFKDATTDPDELRAWWDVHRGAGVAIATGATSGLVVIDEDTGKGGARSLTKLERTLGPLPETFTVLTGGGGKHFYFRHPGYDVRCSEGKLAVAIDVRADGGYVVAAPSPHESGRAYKILFSRDLAELPAAWLDAMLEDRRNGHVPAKAVEPEIPEGMRDSTLASLAGTMRRRGMGEAELLGALRVTNQERCRPPLPDTDVERIARSIASYPAERSPADRQLEPFALTVLTARELCAQPDPDNTGELLGPAVVQRYRTLIGGHTGEGKTSFTIQAIAAIGNGTEFLGFTGRGNVHALFLDAEQGAKSLKRRLREAGLHGCDWLDVIRVPDGLELDNDPRHVAELDRLLREGDYAVVCVDPLYKLHAGDSNAEREAVDLMRRFDTWRDQLGFALLLPLHCRKPIPGLKFSIHDLFGSSAYVRGAEIVLGLQRLRDGYSRLHFLKDRDGDLPIGATWGLLFDRESGFRRDPDDGKREPTTAEQVAELLEATPRMTKDQLVKATGKKPRTVEAALRNLGAIPERRGGAGGHGENTYTLPNTHPSRR